MASNAVKAAVEIFTSEKNKIPTFQPTDDEYRDYEKLVVTSNLLFRFSRPACVVQPKDTTQVKAIIEQIKKHHLRLTIRCGGHSYAGFSTALEDNNILMDLRRMNKVELDESAKTVTFDAGCQWGEVYRALINKKLDGLIVNGGRCPYVGVGGFILGGGLGPFTRTFGTGSDTLLEATLVTANGEIVTVKRDDKEDSDNGKLFWALQGAGQANFGVVTQMKLEIQKLKSKEGKVVGGRFMWFPNRDDLKELRSIMGKFYKADWPIGMTIDTTWVCDLRQKTGDAVRFAVYYDGIKEDYDKVIDEHVSHEVIRKELKRRALEEPSTRFLFETLERQWFDETKKFFAENKTYRIFASFCFDKKQIDNNVGKIITILEEEMKSFRALYDGEDVNLDIVWIHSGGKAAVPRLKATAFYWRQALYHTYVEVLWVDKWMELNMRGFMSKLKQRLRPFSLNKAASFLNFPDRDLAQGVYERAYFGENRKKLRKIKKIWDEDNVFTWPQGVQLPRNAVDDAEGDVDQADYKKQTDQIAQSLWDKTNWQKYEVTDIQKENEILEALGF